MHSISPSIFGTDGIRKRVGIAPLSAETLPKLGYAIASWAEKKYGSCPTIIMGHDTRKSCDEIKCALQDGLLCRSITILDAGLLPTPAAYLLAKNNPAIHCAIIISASHNPYYDNGIKIIDAKTGKITAEDENQINILYHQTNDITLEQRHVTSCAQPIDEAKQLYCDTIINHFPKNLLSDKKIIIDCAHGATCQVAPIIFKALGADLIVINAEPNGENINDQCGATAPEQLKKTVLTHKADIGFAFDGDGDRITVVSRYGDIKDGDDIIAMLLTNPLYATGQTVVGTIMSNHALEQMVHDKNKNFIRTAVGDKYIVQQMRENNSLLGGEPSGHIIIRDYLDSSDGIFTALRLAQTLQTNANWDMHSFIHCPQVVLSVPVTIKKDLTDQGIKHIITSHEELLKKGRIIVRYSGTENMLRIMVEDITEDHTVSLAHSLANKLGNYLS